MTGPRPPLVRLGSPLILGSASASRAALLKGAGLDFTTEPAGVDEDAIRKVLARGNGSGPADVAEVLARAKAETVSERNPGALVIGADQVLSAGARLFEKPGDMEAARATLLALQGKTHQLHSAVALARGGTVNWAHVETASLTMRALTPKQIGRYLSAAGEAALASVGAYQLEALGAHLFDKIEGDYFTILGLPLLPLLARLREEDVGAA
jgi:septum formation protein